MWLFTCYADTVIQGSHQWHKAKSPLNWSIQSYALTNPFCKSTTSQVFCCSSQYRDHPCHWMTLTKDAEKGAMCQHEFW